MSERIDHVEKAQEHLATALEHAGNGRDAHGEARAQLARIREVTERCSRAIKDGDMSAAKNRLDDVLTATSAAHAAHSAAGSSFSRAHRSVQRAVESLDRAADSEQPTGIDEIANPTGAAGSQVSNGQAPRGADAGWHARQRELAAMQRGMDDAPTLRKASTQPLFMNQFADVSEDEVAGICISAGFKRDDAEWVPSGIDLTTYRTNPIVLFGHDPSRIIGTAVAIGLTADRSAVGIKIQFAPAGTSAVVDEVRALAKGGFLKAISAAINPDEVERLPNGKCRVLTGELLEVSLVAVPADADALITSRNYSRSDTDALLRSLPVTDPSARERVLDAIARERRLAELAEMKRRFDS